MTEDPPAPMASQHADQVKFFTCPPAWDCDRCGRCPVTKQADVNPRVWAAMSRKAGASPVEFQEKPRQLSPNGWAMLVVEDMLRRLEKFWMESPPDEVAYLRNRAQAAADRLQLISALFISKEE